MKNRLTENRHAISIILDNDATIAICRIAFRDNHHFSTDSCYSCNYISFVRYVLSSRGERTGPASDLSSTKHFRENSPRHATVDVGYRSYSAATRHACADSSIRYAGLLNLIRCERSTCLFGYAPYFRESVR